ncbi:MAG TPA: fimbria/pilus outer membrane usher protein, partial [Sphingomicrobium sp.]|nr:fimbria/pilus outer membrane usher protein [Sphingomicrobium sp.]
EVRDDTGTHESMALSFFSDTELLDPGISTFSAVAGFRQERSDDRGVGYAGSPAFTGFYERGLSNRLTLGGGLQGDRHNALLSGLGVFATPIGVFGAQGALDLHSGSTAEYAGLLSYRLFSSVGTGRQSSLDVDLEYRSRNFSPMEEAGTDPVRYAYDIAARYQGELVKDWFLSASAGYSIARGDEPDLKSGSVGLSHRWGRINATINYTYLDPAPRADHRIGLTVSLPVGRRQQVRAGFDSDRNRIFADYDLQGFEGLDQLNGHIALARNDEGENAVIDGEYFANRFRATIHHSYDTTNGIDSAVTDLGVAVGLGYAGGEFAIGRDADRGFTIVTKHPTLGNATVVASDTYAVGPSARTGLLGPALVPTQRGYQPDSIKVDVNPLPPGYDIGAGQIDILPGAASGYVMHVGSDASNIVMGRLLDSRGKPVAYASGQLVAIGRAKGTPPTFITNRNGRLVAQKVAPGRYRIVASDGASIGEITVPKDARGMVDVGVLTEKE